MVGRTARRGGLEMSARTVVMALGAVLVLVLGRVLARLWWHRRRSRPGAATPGAALGFSLTLGALILVVGVWLLADAIVSVDQDVTRWFHAHATLIGV